MTRLYGGNEIFDKEGDNPPPSPPAFLLRCSNHGRNKSVRREKVKRIDQLNLRVNISYF